MRFVRQLREFALASGSLIRGKAGEGEKNPFGEIRRGRQALRSRENARRKEKRIETASGRGVIELVQTDRGSEPENRSDPSTSQKSGPVWLGSLRENHLARRIPTGSDEMVADCFRDGAERLIPLGTDQKRDGAHKLGQLGRETAERFALARETGHQMKHEAMP